MDTSASNEPTAPSGPSEEDGAESLDLGTLRELVRQGERVIDNQVRASEEQDHKSRHLLTLAGAMLVVGAAIAGLAGREPGGSDDFWTRIGFAGLLGVGFICGLVGFVYLARTYVGSAKRATEWGVGWDMKTLETAADEEDPIPLVLRSTLIGMPRWYERNSKNLRSSWKRRRTAMSWLAAAGAFLAASLLYAVVAF